MSSSWFHHFLLVLIIHAVGCQAKFNVQKNSLKVTVPPKIAGSYESAMANFGLPQYGGSLSGRVKYPEVDQDACSAFTGGGHNFSPQSGELPIIVLLDRGSCYFTQKVWDAEKAGASAVLVADDKDEPLITMDAPEDDDLTKSFVLNITIPSALITKDLGDKIKEAIKQGLIVQLTMDWQEALPHPDDRVEWELWTNSNDECGPKCDMQVEFIRSFKARAQLLEQGGYTQFTPHYITWYCPQPYKDSKQCRSQCLNNGRYCAPDPEQDFEVGYDGKDVVMQNLRALCVFKEAKAAAKGWLWWDYVSDFQIRCPMKEQKYTTACAVGVLTSLGMDNKKVEACMGDTIGDAENAVLRAEQDAQVGKGDRGDVTILPTVVVNQRQYRGKLDSLAVLKAICSGFKEATDPPPCLSGEVQTNECLDNYGGCWHDPATNASACKDTFRGRVCECPKTGSVAYVGDGYTSCKPYGPGRCQVNNGGCWETTVGDTHYTGCDDRLSGTGCKCPSGFEGDGISCTDIDECSPTVNVCSCPECSCTNTVGSYDCSCSNGMVYVRDADSCIAGSSSQSHVTAVVFSVVGGSVALLAAAGYIIYKYRLRQYMDSEIRAIMAQYMPLDSQNEDGGAQHIHTLDDEEI